MLVFTLKIETDAINVVLTLIVEAEPVNQHLELGHESVGLVQASQHYFLVVKASSASFFITNHLLLQLASTEC
jgi:hypothetical protein